MSNSYIESLFEPTNPGERNTFAGPATASPTPTGVGEVFSAGVKSGAEGLAADTEYFKALFNTATGDDEAAAANVRRARVTEQAAAAPLQNVQSFEEFLDEPTVDGFVTQVSKATGQLLPSAVSSITGGGIGALTGKAAFSLGGKKAVEKVIKDSVERTVKGVADVDEKLIAQASYDYMKRGALVGAGLSEFGPLSGSNLSEALDSGRELDGATAVRAALVAAPQAAIGVGGEAALLKLIGGVAKKRSVKDGDIFANLAKDIGSTAIRGAGIEGATEVAQESISVLNRMEMDDTFDAEQAQLRLAESAFAGFFGGGAMAGGGTAAVQTARAATPYAKTAADKAIDQTANIVDKAKRMLDEARGQRVEEEIVRQQSNAAGTTQTAAEPAADINAQLNAMVNPTSEKKAVWVAGTEPQYSARVNTATPVEVNGKSAFAAFVPGRGTIISTDKKLVDEVVAGQATDAVVGAALGYSSTKSYGNATLVARAVDADGNIVSEELTTQENSAAALEAAKKLQPEGGYSILMDAQQALEERARKVNQEATVKPRDDNPDSFEETDPNETPTFGSEFEELAALREEMQNSQEVEGETEVVGTYAAKSDPTQVFDNEADARKEYVDEFGETDFGELEGVTAAALKAAARESKANPNAVIELAKEGNEFVVRKTFYDKLYSDGPGRKFTLPQFIAAQAQRAGKASPNKQSVIVTRPDGVQVRASLVSLVNAGRRLVENREGARFEGEQGRVDALKQGLSEILADLAIEGYKVTDLNGMSLLDQANYTNGKFNGLNMVAGQLGKTQYRLSFLQTPRFVETSRENEVAVRLYYNDDRGVKAAKEVKTTVEDANKVAEQLMEEAQTLDPTKAENGFYTEFGDPRDREAGEGDFDYKQESTLDDVRPDPNQRSRGGAAANLGPQNTNPTPPDPTQFDDSMVQDSIQQLLDSLKLKETPRVLNFDRLANLTDETLVSLVGEADYPAVKAIVNRMKANGEIGGSYYRGVAVVRQIPNNPLSTLMTAAHEIGHHLYQTEQQAALENNALRPRLLKAFEKHPRYRTYVERYGDSKGFEEWYADQVSRWATKQYINRSAKSMTDRHFKDLAQRLRRLWRAMAQGFRVRKGPKAPEFEQYIEQVVGTRREATKDSIGFKEKAVVAGVREAVVKEGGEALARHWKRTLGDGRKYLGSFFMTADGVLRMWGGDKIADMFYVRSQDAKGGGKLGMLKDAALKKSQLIQDFTDMVGKLDDPDVLEALEDVSLKRETDNPLAQKVRDFFDYVYDDYIEPSNSDIGRRKDYFPISLDLQEIAERPDDFKNLVLAYNSGISPQRAEQAIHKIRQYAHTMHNEDVVLPDDPDPAKGIEAARLLTDNIDPKELRAQEFTVPDSDALVSYISHLTKRVEFNRYTDNGKALRQILNADDMPEETREKIMQVINTYLGYQANPINPLWRTINSWGQLTVFVALLPFATIGSLPELAGPVINSKEFNLDTFMTAFKQIAANIRDRDEARRFAQDIGVVQNEAAANAWVTQADQDYMDAETRDITDKFFKAIGLDFFTKFSREFAAGMGRQFILKHALEPNERSERYLRELGLTAAEVKAWQQGGGKLTTPEGKKVRAGVQRFVESSILRPNSAERPMWASDPRWALVWQLKSYFYAYSKVMGGGVLREGRSRAKEGEGGMAEASAVLGIFALTAVATMPLAMLGMELREYAKNSLAWLLPGFESSDRYFRSDRMDWDEYLFEVVDKSGFLGPLSLGFMAQQSAQYGNSPMASLLGPTAETIDEALQNGWRVDRTLKNRIFPLTVQL
jgi:hypothetical protein